MSEETKGQPPIKKVKIGTIEVAVWQQKGEKGDFLTATPVRNFLDKNNTWQKSNSYRINDIPQLILGLQEVYRYAKIESKEEA